MGYIYHMKALLAAMVLAVAGAAIFLFFSAKTITIAPDAKNAGTVAFVSSTIVSAGAPGEKILDPSSLPAVVLGNILGGASGDIGPQNPLAAPPQVVKGIYLTGWSAGYVPKLNHLLDLVKKTELNAMVIDIKDYSGYVSYYIGNPLVKESGADGQVKISRPNALIKELHDNGVYVIGRVTVFQDPVLASAHPEWALRNASTSAVWKDSAGLAWMDPAAEPVWKYNLTIAQDALARGFDEINFDYLRFASDGNLGNIVYPFWDKKTSRHIVIGNFFQYLRHNMPDAKLSADVFGLATINHDDLGIGQVIEDAYKYFDYVSPMVYPSHYASGFLGYTNPAKYPYEVIKYSLDHALARLKAGETITENATSTPSTSTEAVKINVPYRAKLRPWLQDFNLGAVYNTVMVKKEMQATYDALLNFISTPPAMITATSTLIEAPNSANTDYGGWLLWNPANSYKEDILR